MKDHLLIVGSSVGENVGENVGDSVGYCVSCDAEGRRS